jgi:hypothetical protein
MRLALVILEELLQGDWRVVRHDSAALLWESDAERLKDQLHPAVGLQR